MLPSFRSILRGIDLARRLCDSGQQTVEVTHAKHVLMTQIVRRHAYWSIEIWEHGSEAFERWHCLQVDLNNPVAVRPARGRLNENFSVDGQDRVDAGAA
jgi:hypothetical protein